MKKDSKDYLKNVGYVGESIEETKRRLKIKRIKKWRKKTKK